MSNTIASHVIGAFVALTVSGLAFTATLVA